MYTEGFDQWIKMNKNMTSPLTEWNKATTELCQRAMQQNLELMGENFSRASNQLKRFTSVRKPEELLSLQKECFNEGLTTMLENTQKLIHTTMENLEQFTKLLGSTMRDATPTPENTHSGKSEKK
jgi:hypothetical protein